MELGEDRGAQVGQAFFLGEPPEPVDQIAIGTVNGQAGLFDVRVRSVPGFRSSAHRRAIRRGPRPPRPQASHERLHDATGPAGVGVELETLGNETVLAPLNDACG